MNREFLDYLEDILDAMEKAELLIEGVNYEQFLSTTTRNAHGDN